MVLKKTLDIHLKCLQVYKLIFSCGIHCLLSCFSREYWFGLHHVDPDLTAQCHCDRICPNIDASTSSTPSTTCADCDLCRGADKWQWEDGTLYDFTNWHTTQPSNFNTEKCARFHGDGKWYDNICSDRLYFICKKGMVLQ